MENEKDKYWRVRRKLVMSTMLFSYVTVAFLILKGSHDSSLHSNIMSGIMTLMAGTMIGYIGTAVYDDIDDPAVDNKDIDFWKVRRRLVISNVVFTMIACTYLLLYGVSDSRLHGDIISDLMLCTSVIIVTYIGGSSIQDKYTKKIK